MIMGSLDNDYDHLMAADILCIDPVIKTLG